MRDLRATIRNQPSADYDYDSAPMLSDGDVALPWAVLQAVQLRQSINKVEADH